MNLWQPRVIIAGVGVIALFIAVSFAQELHRRWQYQTQVDQLEQTAHDIEKNVTELSNLNQYFQTPEYVERIAREKLNYRAPGEKVVLIPEDQQAQDTTNNAPRLHDKATPIPLQWWHTFFGG